MTQAKNPWDYMGAEERRILGDIVANPEEQARWCKAMVFGTLPYMWRDKASVVRELAYEESVTNIVCSWHGYEFDLKTGANQGYDKIKLRKVKLEQRDGNVYVVV